MNLDTFANWAQLVDWAIPPELLELARNEQPRDTERRVSPVAAGTGMSNEGSRRAAKWRREKWRREWIAKFSARQRLARRWISFVDLADWSAQATTAASRDAEAKAREVAYQRLTDSVRKGEFERDGRSKVLYLDTQVVRCRLTREQFEIAFESTAAVRWAPSLPFDVLNCCQRRLNPDPL